MSTSKTRVGVIVGSRRKAAYSRRVARTLMDRAPKDWECTIIEIADLPLYNQDLNDASPRVFVRDRRLRRAAVRDAGIQPLDPGALKNATAIL